MKRRTFTASSVVAWLGMATRGLPASVDPKQLDIIDCHTHFYDPNRTDGIPWPEKGSSLYRTVLPQHLRALTQFRPVTGTIIVEASPRVEDNQWLLDLAKEDPFIVGIVGNLRPGEPGFSKLVERFAADRLFRGIRVNASLVKQSVDKSDFADLKRMIDLGLTLDVNGGPDTPAILAKLASKLPALKIVLNHIGNVRISSDPPPAEWSHGIREAANHQNVFVKISALVEGASRNGEKSPSALDFYRPYLDVVWHAFGDDRVIYGSNWPVSEQAAEYETLQRIALEYAFERGDQAARQFCSLNAQKAYNWVEREGRITKPL